MQHYFDIKLLPDSEMKEHELASKVYVKFHKALCDLDANSIGISFPEVGGMLGTLFRLHSSEKQLIELQKMNWLGRLSGYCQISDVQPVPSDVLFRVVKRKRSNMGNSKLRRLMARGSIDDDGCRRYKQKMLNQWHDDPFLDIPSSTTGQTYRKFFEFGKLQEKPVEGSFDTFGLSKVATIPWF